MTCPHCHHDARCKGFRGRTVLTLLGDVRVCRHYYHCPQCHHGTCPRDQLLKLRAHDLTPAADEVVCLTGVQASFSVAATKLLTRLTNLRVSESTVERATEAAGGRVAAALRTGRVFGQPKPWAWHKDAEGKTVGDISLDATGVGQQGPGAAAAEGRMAYVGMIYNPIPDDRQRWAQPLGKRPEWQARYVAGLETLPDRGEPLRRQAFQVGLEAAERWVAIGDGGSGLAEFLRTHFGRVEAVILDFWHVAEYLGELSRLLHQGRAEEGEQWRQEWCHELKWSGGQVVLEKLRGLDLTGRAETLRACGEKTVTYFENQVGRMNYPEYVAKGWQIGSGPVESACKTGIGERMKGGGMRWGEDGANAVAHRRGLFRSETGQWEAFWSEN